MKTLVLTFIVIIIGISGAYFLNNQRKQSLSLKPIISQPLEVTSTPPATLPVSPTSLPPTSTPRPPLVPSIVVPKEIVLGDTKNKQVIFTFDAGSGTESLSTIISVLKKHGLTATFFLTGKWAEDNPESVKQIHVNGHEIFNHTYSHPHLTQTADFMIINEFNKTNDIIENLTGKTTKPYFRPPYGERNDHVLSIAAKQGYQSVYWTIDAWDWRESEGYTPEQIKKRVYDNLKPGTIYLFHVGDNITGKILDEVITHITGQGYKIHSLTQGL